MASSTVAHSPSIHVELSTSCIHIVVQCDFAIIERHHDRGGLECGTWLHQRLHRIVQVIHIVPVCVTVQIHQSLDVTRLDFHQHADAHVTVHLDQLLLQRRLADVLHCHIQRCHHIVAVNRRTEQYIDKIGLRAKHLFSLFSRHPSEEGIVLEFQACCNRVLLPHLLVIRGMRRNHISERTPSQITKRLLPICHFKHTKSVHIMSLVENRQFLQILILLIIKQMTFKQIISPTPFAQSFLNMLLHSFRILKFRT